MKSATQPKRKFWGNAIDEFDIYWTILGLSIILIIIVISIQRWQNLQ